MMYQPQWWKPWQRWRKSATPKPTTTKQKRPETYWSLRYMYRAATKRHRRMERNLGLVARGGFRTWPEED